MTTATPPPSIEPVQPSGPQSLELLAGVLILGLLIFAADAWILVKLWEWFIVPFGAPPIAPAHALGLRLMLTLIPSYAGPPQLRLTSYREMWDHDRGWTITIIRAVLSGPSNPESDQDVLNNQGELGRGGWKVLVVGAIQEARWRSVKLLLAYGLYHFFME